MRNLIASALIATIAATFFAGCGKPNKDSDEQANTPSSNEPKRVTEDPEVRKQRLEEAKRIRDEEKLREAIDDYWAEEDESFGSC